MSTPLLDRFGEVDVDCWGNHRDRPKEKYKNLSKMGWVQWRNLWFCPDCSHIVDLTVTALLLEGAAIREGNNDN